LSLEYQTGHLGAYAATGRENTGHPSARQNPPGRYLARRGVHMSPQHVCPGSACVSTAGWAYMPEGKGKEAYRADRNLFTMLISFLRYIKYRCYENTLYLYHLIPNEA